MLISPDDQFTFDPKAIICLLLSNAHQPKAGQPVLQRNSLSLTTRITDLVFYLTGLLSQPFFKTFIAFSLLACLL